jgi:arylformamidase
MNAIYKSFDKAALEREYNPASRIDNAAALQEKRRTASAKARASLRCSLDVPYGPSEGETLDIFFASQNNAPIQIFFHGGSWRAQDKANYSFLAEPFVKENVICLVVNYSLCPVVSLDEIVRQTRASIAWAYANARIFGGDPNRISVYGHSAGAHLAVRALETNWSEFRRIPDDVIKSAIAISGIYDLEPIRLTATNNDVRLDSECVLRNSPILHPPRRRVPLLLACGTTDNDEFKRQTRDYGSALRQKNYECEILDVEGANHFTILDHLADGQSQLGRRMLEITKCA